LDTDNPPRSIDAVKSNLCIVEQAIAAFNAAQQANHFRVISDTGSEDTNNSAASHGTMNNGEKEIAVEFQKDLLEMIEELKEEIYTALDSFVEKAKAVLLDHFTMEPGMPFDMLTITSLLKLTRQHMEEKISQRVDCLVAEINYVHQMKKLEEAKNKTDHKDIVPITGLIVGRFHRLENELQTVIEVWGSAPSPAQATTAGGAGSD
jgi:hypothetical protein